MVAPLLLVLSLTLAAAAPAAEAPVGEGVEQPVQVPSLPQVSDLEADAQQARREGQVILLVVTRPGCNYCEVLKREVIGPMVRSGDYRDRTLIRELHLDTPGTVMDFQGRQVTVGQLAEQYDEWLTPTVLLLGPEGQELVPRIRGISNLEFYGYYLDQAIEEARGKLGG